MNLKTFVNKYNREPDYVNLASTGEVGGYYITWKLEHLQKKFPLNEDGLPLQDWDITLFRNRSGQVINPHAVAQYALAIHNEYLSSQAEHLLDEFLKLCDWFVANQKKDEPFKGCWAHNYQLPKYHLPNPWFCGMTQGQVVSTLVRAYQLSKKNAYLECAIDACQPLFKSVDDGGLKREFDGGAIFFEEMPTDFFPHILNHHIYTLFGLFDLLQVSGNDRIEELFDESVCSIEKVLTKFDTGSWSKYKLGGKPTLKNHFNWASPFYHNHHIAQPPVLAGLYLSISRRCHAGKGRLSKSSINLRGLFIFTLSPSR